MSNGEKYILLGECAEIRTGQTFKNALKHLPEGDLRVIQPRDLEDGQLILGPIRVAGAEIPMLSKHLLQPGEILIANKGTKFGTFLYQGDPAGVIATASFFVLSPLPGVLPIYLHWYLNQVPAREYFAQHSFGSTIPSITKAILSGLPVPIVSMADQEHIEALIKEAVQEQQLLKLLIDKKKTFYDSYIWERIIPANHEERT